jgi:hypothetical protein
MSTPVAEPNDLGVYLGVDVIDVPRATLILQLANDLCESIVSPLPASAKGTVLEVASRVFVNPQNVLSESVGPYHVQHGSGTVGNSHGGLFLSRANVATLRRLAGGTGAFSIDPTPSDAGQGLMPWDQNVTWLEGVPLAEDQGRQ